MVKTGRLSQAYPKRIKKMQVYATVFFLVLAVLYRTTLSDHDSGEVDFDDSDTMFYNPYEQFTQIDAGGLCNNYKTKGGWAYRPIYGSCNQYLQCNSNHKASLLTCAAGTFYDGSSCRHSAEVYCPYDPCQAQKPGFKYTDGQSCYGYYKCMKGKSRYHTCPDGFYFNSHKQICITDDTCQKNNLIHPCSYGTTHPFPGRPEMFYLYDGREVFYPMKCPKGLWYRPEICSCDWIVPGISSHEGCKPMYHFQYNGNFLEAYNRIQQVPNTGVAIYRKSALFSEGGQIMVWAMNNMNLDKEFAFCFEFMSKVYNGEVALLSNGYKGHDFTYKITYIPAQSLVKVYIELDDDTTAHLVVTGVHPLKPHFVRLAKYGSKIKLRIDNISATMVKTHAHVSISKSPLVIGAAQGCKGFVGHFDEFKFFKCVPNDFFNDYAEKKK
ncbi:Protein PIF [Mizuhopecten yessoensis]|uniref:Protein PIF n=2 Tax=Mizuhopecten yessoensis TaxID=6573 RepID=A0A210R201_MIZYE|nr:Protein PIF [Mizuhopecten yessoensis]